MKGYLTLSAIICLLVLVGIIKGKFNKLNKENSFIKNKSAIDEKNIKALKEGNKNKGEAIKAFNELKKVSDVIEKESDEKKEEFNEAFKNSNSKSASDAFNNLYNNKRNS